MTTNTVKKNYDIVLYGATSFVGQITAQYLVNFFNENKSNIRFAIAGRNSTKLDGVKAALNSNVPIDTIIANSSDASSLEALCKNTKVVISTVGPYLLHGEALIKACVNNGTDYVDLTGESIFIRDMMDKYNEQAKTTNARIVNACGFDSIPSDLGVYYTQKLSKKLYGKYCNTIQMRVKAAKGGLSGGTIASLSTIFTEVGTNEERKNQINNPYLLNNDTNCPNVKQQTHNTPSYDAANNRWVAPFIMESINSRIVHRSNQLLDYQYGQFFKYDEAIWLPGNLKGQLMGYGFTAGILGFAAAMQFDKTRNFLSERVLPKSGYGPSKKSQENGWFDIRFFGYAPNQSVIQTKVTGSKDPGYGSTAMMLGQAAICLLEDVTDDAKGGFWTTAALMGDALMTRLEAHAGMTFSEL